MSVAFSILDSKVAGSMGHKTNVSGTLFLNAVLGPTKMFP